VAERYGAAYNALYRGVVVHAPAGQSGVWVAIPRLNGQAPLGPVQYLQGGAPGAGTQVLVGTVAGIKDDLVILGTLHG
jgi:hypothetical protein